MPASLLIRAFNSATRLGARRSLQTLASMLEDQLFDWRFSTDTTSRIEQSALIVLSPGHQADAKPYYPTRARAVRYAFRRAGVPTDLGFVDVGSGKGKVMLVAALMGFRQIKGIEFAPELDQIARANIARLAGRLPAGAVLQPVCADATQYEFEAGDSVFFLFNPFATAVMEGFCRQVAASLQRHPRRIWVVYADPAFVDVMKKSLPVTERQRFAYGGYVFAVLTN